MAAVCIGFFLVASQVVNDQNAVATAVTLLLGWATFLSNNFQRIEMDAPSIITFMGCLFGLSLAVQYCAAMIYESITGHQGQGGKWRLRWSLIIVAASVLLFASGMTGVGLFHHSIWLARAEDRRVLTPSYDLIGIDDYEIRDRAVHQMWSTSRLQQEVRKHMVWRDGRIAVIVVTDSRDEWRALISYDPTIPREKQIKTMNLVPRSDEDLTPFHDFKSIDAVFAFYQAKH